MVINILLDISDKFIRETLYTVQNILFPYENKFVVTDKINECNGEYTIIYCNENSLHLSDEKRNKNAIYIVLESKTLDFFTRFANYDINDVTYINDIPCIFPLYNKEIKGNPSNLFCFDFIAASFFFLSCWQEYSITERDRKCRIPLNSTIQHKLGIVRIPIVNEYLKIMERQIHDCWNIKLKYKKLPGGQKSYVALTHDVDNIDWSLTRYANNLIYYRKCLEKSLSNYISIIKNIWNKKNIIKSILDIEIKYNAVSTFFFLSDYPRKLTPQIVSIIKNLEYMSFEIGHHISDTSIFENSLDVDREHFEQFVKVFHGERVHTLRFNVHNLFSQLEKNDYLYDSSLLFPEDVGYRTGFTYPHYIFDPFDRRQFRTLAIPLNIMEGSLTEKRFIGLSDSEAEEVLLEFMKKAITYQGVLTVLFHPHYFFINTKTRLAAYDRLLMYLRETRVRMGSCKEIFAWRCDKKLNTIDVKIA